MRKQPRLEQRRASAPLSQQVIETARQAERLNAAQNAIHRAINSTLSAQEIMQRALVESTAALDCESAGIILREGEQWRVAYISGMPADVVGRTFTTGEMPHAQRAIATGDVAAVNDLLDEVEPLPQNAQTYHVRALLVAPLTVRGEIIGVVYFNYAAQLVDFPPYRLHCARQLAVSISLALDHARLYTVEAQQRAELEQRVAERTAELSQREAVLRSEVAERRRAEAALSQQAAQLKEQADLLNLSQDAIIARDIRAHIRFWNRGAAERYGWSSAEVIGQRSHTLLQTIFPSPIEEVYAELLKHGRWEGELVHTRRNGERIIVAARWALQRNAAGQPVGVLEINNDITHQKAAQAQIAYQAHLLANVTDAVFATDDQGIVTAWNHAAEELFRLPAAEALGQPMRTLLRIEFVAPDEAHALALLNTTGRYRGEISYHRRDGVAVHGETTGMTLHDTNGQITGYIAVTRDIGEQKRAQEELWRQAQRLQIVHDIDRAVLAAESPAEIAAAAVRRIRQLAPCDRAAVVLFDLERNEAERLAVDSAYRTKLRSGERVPLAAYGASTAHWEQRGQAVPDITQLRDRPPILDALLKEGLHAYIRVPLSVEGKLIGQLNLAARQPGAFSARHLQAARQIGDSLAVAVQHARLYEAEHRAREIAETLRAANLQLTQSLDLQAVLSTLLDSLMRLTPYDYAQVLLRSDETCLTLAASRTAQQPTARFSMPVTFDARTQHVLARLLTEQASLLVSDTAAWPNWKPLQGMEQARSWMAAPLVAAGRVIGVCIFGRTTAGAFTAEHLHLAEAMAAQAATAIQNAQLFAQVEQGRKQQQALSHRLVEAQETERRTIARELHDEAGQALTSLLIGLGLLEHDAERPAAVIAQARELKRLTDGVLDGLHRLAANLRPASLDRLGLTPALRQYTDQCRRQNGLDVDLVILGLAEDERLAPGLETTIYRVIQESLTNVVRHAHAQHVSVILERQDDTISAIIEDDGLGFDLTEALRRGRLGLLGMQERAEMLGGRLTVESAPNHGTTVYITLPLIEDA